MFRLKEILHHITFWGVLLLAVTAEGWMDLLCRLMRIM